MIMRSMQVLREALNCSVPLQASHARITSCKKHAVLHLDMLWPCKVTFDDEANRRTAEAYLSHASRRATRM